MRQDVLRRQQELMERVKILEEKQKCEAEVAADSLTGVRSYPSQVLNWLQHHTQTRDPHWRQAGARSPYRPFPERPYFLPTLETIDHESITFIVKSRDLMISWLVVGYFTYLCQTIQGTEVLFQSQTESKAADLVAYAKCLVDRQAPTLRDKYPLVAPTAKQSGLELAWRNDSRIIGIPHGTDKIRSHHPTALFMDEAAFIPDAGDSYNEAVPVCQKVVVVSSAGPGWFEEVCTSAE